MGERCFVKLNLPAGPPPPDGRFLDGIHWGIGMPRAEFGGTSSMLFEVDSNCKTDDWLPALKTDGPDVLLAAYFLLPVSKWIPGPHVRQQHRLTRGVGYRYRQTRV